MSADYPPDEMELRVTVTLGSNYGSFGSLHMQDSIKLGAGLNFEQVGRIFGALHKLGESVAAAVAEEIAGASPAAAAPGDAGEGPAPPPAPPASVETV